MFPVPPFTMQCSSPTCRGCPPSVASSVFVASAGTARRQLYCTSRNIVTIPSNLRHWPAPPTTESSAAGNKSPPSPGLRIHKITFLTAFHLPGWRLHTWPVDFIHSFFPNDLQTTRQPSWSTKQPTSENIFQLPSTYCGICCQSSWWARANHEGPGGGHNCSSHNNHAATSENVVICFLFPLFPLFTST